MTARRLLWAAAIALWLVAPLARAQPIEQAREVEADAREAFDEGDFRQAAERFAEAHRLVPSAMTKYNEAQSWYRAGERPAAADAYEEALRIGTLDAGLTAKCRGRLAELEKGLGVLVVATPEGTKVSVGHAHFRTAPTRIHLEPGEHAVEAITTGEQEHSRGVAVVAGETVHLAFPEDPVTAEEPLTFERQDPGQAQRIGGWVGVGLGGIAGIAAVALGASTLRAIGDFKETGNTDAARRAEAVKLRAWTNAAAVAAIVCGGVGFALVFTAPSADGDVGSGLVLTPTGGSVRLTW